MKFSKKSKAAALCAAAALAATTLGAVTPAHAEPVSDSYTIVGSDTLQDVVNALVNGTNITGPTVRATAGSSFAGSFDATGSTLIQTKPNGVRFGRPNGSGDGVKALSRSIDGAAYTAGTAGSPTVPIKDQVDIARSSSGPSTQDPNGALRYIPFGRDALSYAYSGGTAAWASINAATLKDLFNCVITQVDGVTVVPVIPQANSGTRKDFLTKIGIGADYPASVVPSCVKVGQEHDTSHLEDGSAFPNNAVTPISAAQWVAQNTGAGIDRRGSGVQIGSPTGVSPVTGTGTAMVPNQAYYDDTTWGRNTYIVVENARVTPGDPNYDPKLAEIVGTGNAKLGNTASVAPSQAGSVKKKFGFLAPSSTTPLRAPLS